MSHYRLNDVEPSAIVTVNGSEKKIYDNNQIFLNPNDNFEFRFFNPLQEKLGIEIIFNGQKKGNSLLILNPGEDVSIDRFLDEKKKMKYSTYFIDGNNDKAVKATKKNGLVTINFYKEKLWDNSIWGSGTLYLSGCTTTSYNNSAGFNGGNMMHDTLGNTNGMGVLNISDDIKYADYVAENIDKDIDYSNYMAQAGLNNLTSGNINYSDTSNSNVTLDSMVSNTNSFNDRNIFSKSTKSLETGRVEKGVESTQDFETIDIEFESTPFHSIDYYLKPQSTKPKNISKIRYYCPNKNCEYRIRKEHWKYCPKCGEEL